MNTLTKTKVGTLLYYIANTFADGLHRIASSPIKQILYFSLALLSLILSQSAVL